MYGYTGRMGWMEFGDARTGRRGLSVGEANFFAGSGNVSAIYGRRYRVCRAFYGRQWRAP